MFYCKVAIGFLKSFSRFSKFLLIDLKLNKNYILNKIKNILVQGCQRFFENFFEVFESTTGWPTVFEKYLPGFLIFFHVFENTHF